MGSRNKPPDQGIARQLQALCLDARVLQHLPLAAVVTDSAEHITYANAHWEKLTGYSAEELLGSVLVDAHSGMAGEDPREEMAGGLAKQGRWSGELWLRNRDGGVTPQKLVRVSLGSGEAFLTFSAAPEVDDSQKQLMLWQARHDPLTKLPNRILFQERTAQVLQGSAGHAGGAVLSIDIDNFKILNDSVGATFGDRALSEIGMRLALGVRDEDVVARLAADNFAVLMPEIRSFDEVKRVAQQLLETLSKPILMEDRTAYLTASIGVVMFPADGDNPAELLQRADAARLQVKRQGGAGVAFFEADMNRRAEQRFELELGLREALARGELELHYQPILDLNVRRIVAAEALLRWIHPEKGVISPGEFIPIAEETGLIEDIGAWVIDEAQRKRDELIGYGFSNMYISVNLSTRQLRSAERCAEIIGKLVEKGAHGIVLELTESALIDDRKSVKQFITRIRNLGARVALDDFGTGFSSLSYLREFEFDSLKVDRSFIMQLHEPRVYGLVASIVSMGRILGMRIVAEGIEEEEQARRLQQIGCDYVQGFLFSRPLRWPEFLSLLDARELRAAG